MALELPGSLFAAQTIGLFVWALRKRVTAIPAWAVPLLAGIGMIGTTVWMEDTWFDRVSGALPAGFAVANEESGSSPLRPWTYVVPLVNRFTALDVTKHAHHPERPELVVAPVFGFSRWQNALMVFDCAGKRRVAVTEGMKIDTDGTLTGADWLVLETTDGLQEAACKEGWMDRKPRILVVEYEDNIAVPLDYLMTRKGYDHDRVASGADALPRIRQSHPDLVRLDVMLPEVSGYEICEGIRMDPSLADVKVLMMTARG